jgi:3-hydroxymyristoyl/3-hydroxydecanoyl-(acyl carrier protein) dehydratase
MALPVNDIAELIPQKRPFVMVGKLVHVGVNNAVSRFTINSDNVFIKGYIFQEAGLMENIAQTAALREGYLAQQQNKAVSKGHIITVKDFEVLDLPRIGDELQTEIIIEEQILNMAIISGTIYLNERLIASCEMKVVIDN